MRNKKIADIILILLILIFILLAALKHAYGETFTLRMIVFIVEAALVGSIADWFAVTALFKKPLGLPIHPVIPTNKDKILNSLGTVVNDKLLDMNYIQGIVNKLNISRSIIDLINDADRIHKAKGVILTNTLELIKKTKNNPQDFNIIRDNIYQVIDSIDFKKHGITRFIHKMIQIYFTKESFCWIIDLLIEYCSKDTTYTKLHKFVKNIVDKKTDEMFFLIRGLKGLVDIDELSKAIQLEGINYLHELKRNDEEYFKSKKIIIQFSREYINSTELRKIITDFTEKFAIEERLKTALNTVEDILIVLSSNNDTTINNSVHIEANLKVVVDVIIDFVKDLIKEIKKDEESLKWIDSIVKNLLLVLIAKNRNEFSEFIEERIKSFTDLQLSNLIKTSAGEPLHWIRINGAMVGSVLGLIFFSFINFLYDPYILPLAQKLVDIFQGI
jgi:uncharacterized membrane-anchored protein YjiN (DUF445 family)